MKTIGLAPNPHKPKAVRLAADLAGWLGRKNVRALVTEDAAICAQEGAAVVSEEDLLASDLLLVLGGDGTMLRWSRVAAPKGVPMLGVNFGQYGFITEVHPQQVREAVERYLEGECRISERTVLEAEIAGRGAAAVSYALNDVVVTKGPQGRMLALRTYVNDRFIATYATDGIIVATPTGSTAYSLSAGGPVVSPDVEALIITPICAHTLNARSLVVPDSERVRIVGECQADNQSMTLMVDGQVGGHLDGEDTVEVRKAGFKARLVQISAQSFYDKLQTRLRWGERISADD